MSSSSQVLFVGVCLVVVLGQIWIEGLNLGGTSDKTVELVPSLIHTTVAPLSKALNLYFASGAVLWTQVTLGLYWTASRSECHQNIFVFHSGFEVKISVETFTFAKSKKIINNMFVQLKSMMVIEGFIH